MYDTFVSAVDFVIQIQVQIKMVHKVHLKLSTRSSRLAVILT